jgi:AcrR family transcriptional regulator
MGMWALNKAKGRCVGINIRGNSRSIGSKEKIREALFELLKTKGIDQISVIELCKEANVNRTTFYAHYKDIFDLMDTLESNMACSLYSKLTVNMTGEEEIAVIVDHIRKNSKFYKIYADTSLESKLVSHMISMANEGYVEQFFFDQETSPKDAPEYLFEFLKGGMMGVIRRWLTTDCIDSDEVIVRFLSDTIRKCQS